MTVIKYRINKGNGEWQSCFGRGDVAEFRFTPEVEGTLTVGTETVRLKASVGRISLRELKEGVYYPTLNLKSGSCRLEGVRVTNRSLTPLPTEDATLRRLLERTEALERALSSAEEKISELYTLCRGNELFN